MSLVLEKKADNTSTRIIVHLVSMFKIQCLKSYKHILKCLFAKSGISKRSEENSSYVILVNF